MRLGDPASLGIMYTYGVPLYLLYMGIAWHPVAASAKAILLLVYREPCPATFCPRLNAAFDDRYGPVPKTPYRLLLCYSVALRNKIKNLQSC